MIDGWIDARDTTARVSLRLIGPNGSRSLRFEIDTGFYGDILIPVEWALLLTSDFDVPSGRHGQKSAGLQSFIGLGSGRTTYRSAGRGLGWSRRSHSVCWANWQRPSRRQAAWIDRARITR